MAANETLQKIIGLDEKIAEFKEEFEKFPYDEQENVLTEYYAKMLEALGGNDPVPVGLVRVAEMLLTHGTARTTRLLSDGLGHVNLDVRLLSGDVLLHLAEEGLEQIMPAVEEALTKGGLRAEEMPFLLTDIDHPEVPQVLERFLALDNADIVASAIEAIAEFGDPSPIAALKKLETDNRTVEVEKDGVSQTEWTIGHLAKETISLLSEEE
ncbi:MAG: hypothetical protein GY847_26525 [Proteobacteria bacterium]|nr:hypothetical protein [Pseudomonadota bacterium]